MIGDARHVLERLQIGAQVIHHRKAEHCTVGAIDEKRHSTGATGHDARRRDPGSNGALGRKLQDGRVRKVTGAVRVQRLELFVVIVITVTVCRDSGRITDVEQIAVKDFPEIEFVTNCTNHGCAVIVERRKNCLLFVGPGRGEIF